MQIFHDADTSFTAADPATFRGPVHVKLLASAEQGAAVRVYHVVFDAGGRTNWHSHSGPQWLLVIDGRIRVQRWGEPPRDVAAGDAVMIAPGDKHWHGAVAGSSGAHLAVNVNLQTEWLEPVSDADYVG
jgi:quercetin dioxygenase-like cupin family protein